MKGQVFTIAKLYYVNGVVYEVAQRGTTDLQTLADLSAQTTKTGNVEHPLKRVRDLARLAEGIGLIDMLNKGKVQITPFGKKYYEARSGEKWSISKEQQRILGKYIISDYYRTETIYAITTLFELCKKGYTGKDLSHQPEKHEKCSTNTGMSVRISPELVFEVDRNLYFSIVGHPLRHKSQ